MTLRAKDLMEQDVHYVNPETPLLQVHRLFVEEEINGAPVVDEEGKVVGVISSLDLLRAVAEAYEGMASATMPVYFREELPFSGPDWGGLPEDFQDRMAELSASDAMVREVVTVTPETPISDVARLMREHRIHRVLVTERRELRGILSTFDLIGALAEAPKATQPSRPPLGAGPSASQGRGREIR